MNKKSAESIGKNAIILSFAKMIVILVGMIIAMLMSRYLTLKEYGTYSTILLITNIFITIFVLGLPSSINFFLSNATKEEQQNFTSIYYTLSTILCLFAGLLIVLFLPFLENYFNNSNLKFFWYVLAILPWTKVILSSIDNFLVVFNKTKLLMTFKVINSIIILFCVLLIKIFKLTFAQYMLLYIVVEVLFSLIAIKISTMNVGKINFNFSKKAIKKILKFSLPLGIASVVGTLTIELGKIIIGGFFDMEKLAIYANASKEMPVTIIATSLTAVLMPQLVKLFKQNKTKKAIDLWITSTTLSYIFMCFFVMILFFNAKEVITILYSEKYLPGIDVFRVYTLVLLFRTTYFGMILNSIGKTKFILYSSLLSLFLNLILSYICYYIYGFIGPAIATFISIGSITFFQLKASAKNLNVKFKDIMSWGEILKITIINVALAIVFNFIKVTISKSYNINAYILLIVIIIIWTIVYGLIMKKTIFSKWKELKV